MFKLLLYFVVLVGYHCIVFAYCIFDCIVALDLGVCTSNGLIAEVITLASTGSRQDNFNQISTHKLDQCSGEYNW